MNKQEIEIFKKYIKRKSIYPTKDEKSNKIIPITSKELKEINLIIKHPIIQTTLNDDKIKEMCELYNDESNFSHHFLACALITIARIIVGDKEDYYLVDGQHRINMALDLLEEDENNNMSFLLAIITVKTKNEMESLMKSINKDSLKYKYIDYPIFDQILFQELKEIYLLKYIFLPKRASDKSKIYTANEFIDLLIKIKFDKIEDFNSYIQKKDKDFFNKIGYLEKLHDNKDKFNKKEIECIENKSCMFMKNNNFLEWLINNSIIPYHDFNERPTISKDLQTQVWQKEYGSLTSGHCPIYNCKNDVSRNISNSWQCGHIISLKHKGPTNLENLRPLCTPCNQKMSYTNWDIYEHKLMKNKLIEEYFEENIEIICKSKNKCKNIINILTFEPYYYQTKNGNTKLKPICLDCNKY